MNSNESEPKKTELEKTTRNRSSFETGKPELIKELIFVVANPAETRSDTEVCKLYGISTSQLVGFKKRHSKAIKAMEDMYLAKNWDDVIDEFKILARRAVLRAGEALHKASAKDAAVIASLATEKVAFLEKGGVHEVNVIHEHRDSLGAVGELLVRELEKRGLNPKPEILELPRGAGGAEYVDEETTGK